MAKRSVIPANIITIARSRAPRRRRAAARGQIVGPVANNTQRGRQRCARLAANRGQRGAVVELSIEVAAERLSSSSIAAENPTNWARRRGPDRSIALSLRRCGADLGEDVADHGADPSRTSALIVRSRSNPGWRASTRPMTTNGRHGQQRRARGCPSVTRRRCRDCHRRCRRRSPRPGPRGSATGEVEREAGVRLGQCPLGSFTANYAWRGPRASPTSGEPVELG